MFNTNRMVRQYAEKFYAPAAQRWDMLTANGLAKAKELAGWALSIARRFPNVRIEGVSDDVNGASAVGRPVRVKANVNLGELPPEDVRVQLYYGGLDSDGQLRNGTYVDMQWVGPAGDLRQPHLHRPDGLRQSGMTGYTVRILPRHGDMIDGRELCMVKWA